MNKRLVSIVKYKKPLESVRKAVELSQGLDHLTSKDIKEMIAVKGCPPKPK